MQDRDEGAALAREGRRAVRHFFVLWFGFPLLAVLAFGVIGRAAQDFSDESALRAILLFCVGGTLTVLFGRWLWRLVKS
jgi:hypothetical protein